MSDTIRRRLEEMAPNALIVNSGGIQAHDALGYREVGRLVHFARNLR
jgi:hypothetical protein